MPSFISDAETTLSEKPIVGLLCTILGYSVTYIDHLSPFLKFASLCLGVIIGVLTVVIKAQDLISRYKSSKNENKE